VDYQLIAVTEAADWAAFHTIRRVELFEAKGRFGIYSDTHPDDVADFAHPFLLKCNGKPVCTVRLDDFGDGTGAIRLVAVPAEEQGRGHGRVMDTMVTERARALGIHTLLVNAAPEAVGFYEKTGWERYEWDPSELVSIAASCIQMRKLL
jgi:N-acetylglutamate synthase-like GNAT family acetyltransferase